MRTFGMNLLGLASSVIGFQEVQWLAFDTRVQNARGLWENTYEAPVTITGSWQPVGETTIQNLGLDTSRKYYNLYTSNPVQNVNRGTAPDRLIHDGSLYDVVGNTDWYEQNGWRGILCVYVGPA